MGRYVKMMAYSKSKNYEVISQNTSRWLLLQLKLFPSLFELKDNDTAVLSIIIKKLKGMSRKEAL